MVIEGYYSQVADEIVANIQHGNILDLGTGPGHLPIQIVKRAPDVEVMGIDLSRKLIQMATDNAWKAGFSSKLSFEVGDETLNTVGVRTAEDGVDDADADDHDSSGQRDPVNSDGAGLVGDEITNEI